jgi:hypothetical protein
MFVADTQNNRIIKLTFSPTSFEAEPVVTEFLVGLNDPWDCVETTPGRLAVSERGLHRIVEYDMDTGALVRVIVQGAALSRVDSVSRFVTRLTTVEQIQAQPCVGPEGLFVQDGWLYFGSTPAKQVRKVHLETGEVKVACPVTYTRHYVKVAVSDGTFGPRGTIFTWTWTMDGYHGFPEVYLPDGVTKWRINSHAYLACGKGGQWDTLGYGHSGGVGKGRLYLSSSIEGLVRISKALPTDPTPDYVKYANGRKDYIARGFRLVYGDEGHGYYGLPLPWGVSPEIDYYLSWNGHIKP